MLNMKLTGSTLKYLVHRCEIKRAPMFIGDLAVEIGASLERTEEAVNSLVASGTLRILSDDEKQDAGFEARNAMCCLSRL